MTPEDIEFKVIRVWNLFMAIETVRQAAHLMRNDFHHSECYKTYLKDSTKSLSEKRKLLRKAVDNYYNLKE